MKTTLKTAVSKKKNISSKMNDGMTAALKAQKNSHSPYSKKKVGASIVLEDGRIYSGCNIENASYGGTVCAERVAVWKARSENTKLKIQTVYVVSPGSKPWTPCGFCRQVLAEFCQPQTNVICFTEAGVQKTFQLCDLLPESFTAKYL